MPGKAIGTEWYKDESKRTHVARYSNATEAAQQANFATSSGWKIQVVSTTNSHINLGPMLGSIALTAGKSLLLGDRRTRGTITVLFWRELDCSRPNPPEEAHHPPW